LQKYECHFEGAKRLRNPMQSIVPNVVRDLSMFKEILRLAQDDLLLQVRFLTSFEMTF
jgi:hypothetical protein